MNALLRSITLGAVGIAETACASTQPAATARPVAQPVGGSTVDAEYVALVESIARQRGVAVRWVNPPTRRVTTLASR